MLQLYYLPHYICSDDGVKIPPVVYTN
ncbi:uncharacterized protein METZ01_LOCUS450060 [marine metagenome]|uniref:Uncharacterized protein n=1 Tax=marine metagenome TaxID=408172 RepID=A0A382ZNP3_9ZZZZ